VIVTLAMVARTLRRATAARRWSSAERASAPVGGGNLEATAIHRAREMLADGSASPSCSR
jgi:xanthine dehydrogenase accessory factor